MANRRSHLQRIERSISANTLLEDLLILPLPQKDALLTNTHSTGSGAWAFDMADKYESAKVTGVDLAPVQPAFVPDNCQFEVLDIEDEWLFRKASFDFIHARELILSIRDFPRLFRQAYDHIRPGGSMELTSSIASPSSDDGSLKPDAAILILERMFFEMGEKMNTPIDSPKKLKAQLEEAGFVDVVENIVKCVISML